MFCPKCGASITDGSSFCKNCGAPVNSAPGNNAQPQQPAGQPAYTAPVNRVNMPAFSYDKPTLIKFGIIAALQLFTFIFWFIDSLSMNSGRSVSFPLNAVVANENVDVLGTEAPFGMDMGFVFVFTILFFIATLVLCAIPFFKKTFPEKWALLGQAVFPVWSLIWLIAAFAHVNGEIPSGYDVSVSFAFGGWFMIILIVATVGAVIYFYTKGNKMTAAQPFRPAPGAAPYNPAQQPQQNQYNNYNNNNYNNNNYNNNNRNY